MAENTDKPKSETEKVQEEKTNRISQMVTTVLLAGLAIVIIGGTVIYISGKQAEMAKRQRIAVGTAVCYAVGW